MVRKIPYISRERQSNNLNNPKRKKIEYDRIKTVI